jgi:hypothetical protein
MAPEINWEKVNDSACDLCCACADVIVNAAQRLKPLAPQILALVTVRRKKQQVKKKVLFLTSSVLHSLGLSFCTAKYSTDSEKHKRKRDRCAWLDVSSIP